MPSKFRMAGVARCLPAEILEEVVDTLYVLEPGVLV